MKLQNAPHRKLENDNSEGYLKQGPGTRRRLTESILSLYILQGLNYVIPMAVLPYLVRVLGMEMYGQIAFTQSFAQYFTLLTDYGFNFSATRSIAQQSDDHSNVSRIFCSVLLIKLALTLVGALILIVIVGSVPRFHQTTTYFFVAYGAVVGGVLFPTWYFQGMEEMRYISGIIGVSRLLGAGALFVFVHRPSDALLALAIQSTAPFVGGIAGLWIAIRRFHLRWTWPASTDLRSALVEGWHLFVSTAAVSLYTNTNVFLVGLLAGNLQAGYFSAAEKLIRAMQGLITPIGQAVFPHVNALAARSRDLAIRFTSRMLLWTGFITLLSSLLLLVFARPVALLCFGHAAIGSVPIIRWIAFLPFLVAISNVLGVQTMIPFGLDKQFSRILIVAGLFNVSLAIPLIHLFAALGAGVSVLFTEIIVTITMIFVLRHHNIPIYSREKITA
jgi:PST family polysaccharide transporter